MAYEQKPNTFSLFRDSDEKVEKRKEFYREKGWKLDGVPIYSGTLLLEDGTLLPVLSQLDAADGTMVHVGFRPEQAELVEPGRGAFDARLEMIEEMGAARLCHLLFEDIPVSVLTEGRPALPPGAPVGIRFAQEALHLFDALSGHRIDLHRLDTRVVAVQPSA